MRKTLLAGASLAILMSASIATAADINIDADTNIDSSITFGAGEKFTNSNDALYAFNDGNDSTVYNVTFDADAAGADISGSGERASGIATTGKLTINGGTFNVSNSGSDMFDNTSQLAGYQGVEVNGGTINLGKGTSMFAGMANEQAGNVELNGGTVNVNGGTILASSSTDSNKIIIDGATVNVTEGNLVGKSGIEVNSGTLNNNGTINAFASKASAKLETPTYDGVITVAGGDYSGEGDSLVKGGTYNSNNATLNGKLVLSGTASDTVEKTLAAAPVANFSGVNKVSEGIEASYGVVNVADGASLESDITYTTGGLLDLKGTVKGNVGGDLTLASFGSAGAQIDGNLAATEVDFRGPSSLSSAVTGTYNVAGDTNVYSNFAIDKDGTTKNLNIFGGKTTVSNNFTATTQTKVKSGNTLEIAAGKTLTTANLRLENNTNLNIGVDNGGEAGALQFGKVSGTVDYFDQDKAGATVNMIIANGTKFAEEGSEMQISGAMSEDGGTADSINLASNALYDLSLDKTSGKVTAKNLGSDKIAANLADAGVAANQAKTIAALASVGATGNDSGDAAFSAITAMAQSGNNGAASAAATALAPETAPAVASTTIENTNQIFSAVGSRMSGMNSQGKSSGDVFHKASAWVQGLFNKSDLERNSKGDGFHADTTGIAMGVDKQINDDTKLGIGYAYNQTDIHATGKKTDADAHTALLYGEYKPSNWYANATAAYTWSDYDEKKNVAGIAGKSKYDVDSFGLQAMTGYDMNLNSVVLTPEAGLRYVHIDQDGYTDSFGQSVSSNQSDILTGVIGAKISKEFAMDNGMRLKPEAKLAATYDFLTDAANSTVSLANGSAYVVDGRRLDRFGIEAGLGLTAEVNDNVELSAAYEGKFRDDYSDHTGLLQAKYNF